MAVDLGEWHGLPVGEQLLALYNQSEHNHDCIEATKKEVCAVEVRLNARIDGVRSTMKTGVVIAATVLGTLITVAAMVFQIYNAQQQLVAQLLAHGR